jgi:O-antigen/teichoic acid export membrane protein
LTFVAPCILWRDLLRSVSFAHLDTFAALKTDTIVFITQLGLLAVCYSVSRLSVNSLLLLTGISSLIGCMAWWWIERRPYQLIPREAVIDWIANWKISRWLVAARVFGSSGTIIVPWVVAYGQGTAAAGLLAAGSNLVAISFMFSRGLNNFFRPQAIEAFCSGGEPLLRRSLARMAWIFGSYMLGITMLFVVAGDFLMAQIYGESFRSAGGLVVVLSLVTLATSLSMVGDNGVTALSRPDLAFWAELANGAVTIGLSVLLIGPFSLPGVAFAMLMGQTTGAAVLR